MAFFQRTESSDLVTRITYNANAASSALNLIATSLGRDLFTIVGLLVVMLSQDVILTFVALIGVPLVFAAVTRLLRQMRKLFASEVRSMASIVGAMQETIHGVRVIKAFRLEEAMRARMADAVSAVERLSNRMATVQAGTVPLIDTLGGFAVSSVIFYGGWRVIYNGATPGEFLAFIASLLMMTDPARRLARLHLSLAASAVGVGMLYELIDRVPDLRDKPDAAPLPPGPGAVRFEEVTFGYDPAKPVLHGVSLSVPAGSITALVGLSGSGKSTLFNLLLRFWLPQQGRVLIDGHDLAAITSASLYDRIALVSQDTFLFDGTVAENIQRIAIARAFLKNAAILLLDEPTSALDAESDALIQQALARLMHGRTTLIIAHRLATVANADSILVLDQGRIAETGTHASLLAENGIYARLFQLQFAHSHEVLDINHL